jgi:hypothetical protein
MTVPYAEKQGPVLQKSNVLLSWAFDPFCANENAAVLLMKTILQPLAINQKAEIIEILSWAFDPFCANENAAILMKAILQPSLL